MGVALIIDQLEVIEGKVIDRLDLGIDLHAGKREGLAGELQFGLLDVIGVEVQIAEGVDEFAGFVSADLRDHHGEKRVGGDVEGHPEEKVGAALVELAAEAGSFGIGVVDVKLKKEMAGWQGHFLNLGDIPCGNEMAS